MDDVVADEAARRARAASTSRSRMSAQDVERLERAVASLTSSETSTDGAEGADAVAALARTIEGYREQATLLDPMLSSLIEPLIARVAEACTRRGVIQSSTPTRDESVKRCCEALNALSSVRGWKTCVRFYPNAAKFLEPSIRYLREVRDEGEFWQVRQVVVAWQSILAIVPFDLVTVNSSSEDDRKSVESDVPSVVREWMCDLRLLLRDPGGIRDVAAKTIGRLLTRRDTSTLLRDFVQFAHTTLRSGVSARNGELVFLCPGILSALVSIFKAGSRELLLRHAESVWTLIECIADSKLANDSTLVRQLCIKLGSRVGMVFLKPRVVSWRYDRGRRCLHENLDPENRRPILRGGETQGPDDADATFEVPETIDDIIELSLQGLRDCETIVRWTSAKALGRISAHLPRDFADEVVGAVLDCLSVIESDSTWHGGCLALAELARRGLLLPNRLPETVPRCLEALTYDKRRGAHSIGAHVRDAAAYVCWAFARAYAPEIFEPFVSQLAPALLRVSCFDREVNCRRAAAAAFQESVGRIGTFPHGIEIVNKADYFSLGSRSRAVLEVSSFICQFEEYKQPMIEHVFDQSLTHWELATRQLAASAIGALGAIDAEWITGVGLRTVITRCSSSDLPTRHGAMIALGEIFILSTRTGVEIPSELCDDVVRVIERIEDKNIFRGKGGEIMRSAACRLFECIASVGQSLAMDSRVWRILVDVSEDCLKCSSVDVQVAASQAIVAFVLDRCSSDDPFVARRLLLKHADVLDSEPLGVIRRGSALVLGGFPPRMLCGPHATSIEDTEHPAWRLAFAALVRATEPEENVELRDAETRVNAAYSLVEMVVSMLSFAHEARESSSLTVSDIKFMSDCAVNTLLNCLHDYCVDNRGDVGSWIREAAMKSLPVLVGALQRHDALSSAQAQIIVQNVLKQSLEKIDRVRCQAIATLVQLVRGDEELKHSLRITGGPVKLKPLVDLLERDLLDTVLPSTIDNALDASNASVIFQTMVPLLKSKAYAQFVLSGWFVSAGSGGERLVRCASQALLDAIRTEKSLSRVLAGSIVANLRVNKREDRVTVPTIRAFDKLMCRGLLEEEQDESFEMVELIRYECFSSRDVAKLVLGCVCLSYYVGHSVQRVSDSAVMGLLALLNNRYPRVRLAAVEHLYVGLQTFSKPSQGVHRVVQIISLSSWDAPPSVTREIRMQMYDLLGLEIPAFLRKSNRKVAKEVRGEETSYATLVDEAGY